MFLRVAGWKVGCWVLFVAFGGETAMLWLWFVEGVRVVLVKIEKVVWEREWEVERGGVVVIVVTGMGC